LDTVAESELRDQLAERPLVLLLAEQRRAHDHRALVAAGERTREGAQEHILALPGSDPADHRGDERLSTAARPALAERLAAHRLGDDRRPAAQAAERREGRARVRDHAS